MGQNKKKAVKTAAAMQLSEEWILISDDLEDGSLLRRGKPTLHKMYNQELAINASDTLQTVMWKVLFDNLPILGVGKTTEIIDEFYSMIIRTEIGQTVEIKWFSDNKLDFTDEDWYFIGYSKSGYYSIGGPIRLGAIIAGATTKQLKLLSNFGLELGICWQLVDDILDITSDFKGLKQFGNDIYEGKRTIILGHLLRLVTSHDKRKLLKILNKKRDEKSEDEVSWVINKMTGYGSIDYARKLAIRHKEKCERVLDEKLTFLKSEPERTKLKHLVEFILERKY
jgi:geranylgeranyl diphosphate synthase type II